MARYKIADVVFEMPQKYEETAPWYEEYITDEPLSLDVPLTYRQESVDYFVREGLDITPPIAENMVLCNVFNRMLLRSFNGSYIHSSAIKFKNKAYLFSASSGVGKSTLTKRFCRLYPEDTKIINDDKPSFRLIDGKCIIYGTPFAGGTSIQCNDKAELGAIVFIERAEKDKLVRLTSQEVMPLLFSQVPRKYNSELMDKVLSLYDEIISKYPFYKLYCTNSDEAVHTVFEITEQF